MNCGGAPRVWVAPPPPQNVSHFIDRRLYVRPRSGPHDDHKDNFREWLLAGIIFIERSDRNKSRVIARLAQKISQRLHHAHYFEWLAIDLYFLVDRFFVRKKRFHQIDAEHANVGTLAHVGVRNETAATYITGLGEFVIRRNADHDGGI